MNALYMTFSLPLKNKNRLFLLPFIFFIFFKIEGSIYHFGGLLAIRRGEVQIGYQRQLLHAKQVRLPTELKTGQFLLLFSLCSEKE